MRLKPEKIEQLVELIYTTLEGIDDIRINAEKATILAEIKRVITEDLLEEDKIEEEARKLLDEHADDIRRYGASYGQMLRKTVKKLARDRGMIL